MKFVNGLWIRKQCPTDVRFLDFDSCTVDMQDNVFGLKRYTLKYLWLQERSVSNLFSSFRSARTQGEGGSGEGRIQTAEAAGQGLEISPCTNLVNFL